MPDNLYWSMIVSDGWWLGAWGSYYCLCRIASVRRPYPIRTLAKYGNAGHCVGLSML